MITVSVPATDPGRALAFYAGTRGLKLARVDETMLGIRRVQVTAGGATRLSLVTWGESIPPGCLRGLVLWSSDLAAGAGPSGTARLDGAMALKAIVRCPLKTMASERALAGRPRPQARQRAGGPSVNTIPSG